MNGLLYYVKENQTPPNYSSLNFFIFVSLQFSNIKTNSFLFSQGLKVESLSTHGQWVGASESSCSCLFCLYFFNFLSLQFQNIFSPFFVRPTKMKLDTHIRNGLIYCVYQNQAPSTYLFFIFLLFSVSPISKH